MSQQEPRTKYSRVTSSTHSATQNPRSPHQPALPPVGPTQPLSPFQPYALGIHLAGLHCNPRIPWGTHYAPREAGGVGTI
ncbi:hypothetical protein HanRHA438_Chr07g0307761 [Helianthus annuus]|nr:hypothetical protein HanRHA438_Chr07g0307761 [Helianthus annuus]